MIGTIFINAGKALAEVKFEAGSHNNGIPLIAERSAEHASLTRKSAPRDDCFFLRQSGLHCNTGTGFTGCSKGNHSNV